MNINNPTTIDIKIINFNIENQIFSSLGLFFKKIRKEYISKRVTEACQI